MPYEPVRESTVAATRSRALVVCGGVLGGNSVWGADRTRPKRHAREALRRARRERRRGATAGDDDGDIPDGQDPDEGDTIGDGWKDRLLERITAMDPSAFERLCQRPLREADFE